MGKKKIKRKLKPYDQVPPTQCSYCKLIMPMDTVSEHRKTCSVKQQQSNGKKSRCGARSNRQASYNNHRYYETFLLNSEE